VQNHMLQLLCLIAMEPPVTFDADPVRDEKNKVMRALKPIEPDRLERALDKVERFAGQPRPDVRALARELAAELSPSRKLERIASRVGEQPVFLLDDVLSELDPARREALARAT